MATWDKPDFRGNPYVTITAIDTSGGIATSRTSGTTPMFFHASAKDITATGTTDAWSDLEFRWVLRNNDGSLIEHEDTLTDPSTGLTVDPLTDQFGPEAAFVLREAGTYRLRLYCRGKNGGTFTEATVDQTITVTAFTPSNTYYVDPVSGDNGNSGTEIAPKADLTGLIGSDTAIYLKAGTTLETASQISTSAISNFRLGTYGGSERATIKATAAMVRVLSTFQTGASTAGTFSDIVYSNLDIDGNQLVTGSVAGGLNSSTSGAAFAHTYFDNCRFRNTGSGLNILVVQQSDANTGGLTGLGYWNCSVEKGTLPEANGIFQATVEPWRFFFGGLWTVNATDNIRDHPIYDSGAGTNRIYKWINFGDDNNDASYCLNLDSKGIDEPSNTDYVLVDGCYGGGTDWFSDASGEVAPNTHKYERIIWQFNACSASLRKGDVYYFDVISRATLRYNVFWGARDSWSFENSGDDSGECFSYGNKWYMTDQAQVFGYFPTTYSADHLFRDNEVYCTRATATDLYQLEWALESGQTRDFDDNLIYFPNTTPVVDDRGGIETETWANWQSKGYDANSTLYTDGTTPDWPDPANGLFAATQAAEPSPPDGVGRMGTTSVGGAIRPGSAAAAVLIGS